MNLARCFNAGIRSTKDSRRFATAENSFRIFRNQPSLHTRRTYHALPALKRRLKSHRRYASRTLDKSSLKSMLLTILSDLIASFLGFVLVLERNSIRFGHVRYRRTNRRVIQDRKSTRLN